MLVLVLELVLAGGSHGGYDVDKKHLKVLSFLHRVHLAIYAIFFLHFSPSLPFCLSTNV